MRYVYGVRVHAFIWPIFYAWPNINRKSFIEREKIAPISVHACTSVATAAVAASISSKHNTKRSKLVMCFVSFDVATTATATVAASGAFLWFLLSMFSLLYVLFSGPKSALNSFPHQFTALFTLYGLSPFPTKSPRTPLNIECKHQNTHARELCRRRGRATYGRRKREKMRARQFRENSLFIIFNFYLNVHANFHSAELSVLSIRWARKDRKIGT